MLFDFFSPQQVVFGKGRLQELPRLLEGFGNRAALITGGNAQRIQPVFSLLKSAKVNPAAFSVSGEPSVEQLKKMAQKARTLGCDFVVAFGGGSVLDAGKALSALLTNSGDPLDYLEVVGKGLPLTKAPAPCIAIPTTAGTGAEATWNAVLTVPEHRVKVSLRHPDMLPDIALIDPECTYSMPPEVTASTGLDALTQLMEAFVSLRANPFTDAFCREGLRHTAQSLLPAFRDRKNEAAREGMALASLLSGMALARAGLGAVHGIAGPFGGMFSAPHGAVCAALLAPVFQTNLHLLMKEQPKNPVLEKYQEMAQLLTSDPSATASDLPTWIESVLAEMQIPKLSSFGFSETDIPELTEKARRASSMKGNPIPLSAEALETILLQAL